MMRSTGTYVTFSAQRKDALLTAQIEGAQATLAGLDWDRLDTPLGHAGFPASR